MKNKKNIKIFSYSIVLLAISLILGYVEAIFPLNIGQIGIKIGLGNIVSILGLKFIGRRLTIVINILRLIVLGILFGNMVRFVISITGFAMSYVVLDIALNIFYTSTITSSIFSSIFHNLGQILAVSFILKNNRIFVLVPIYTIIGIITGLFVGVISVMIIKKIW